jgi:CheY-like chemotaxis protein
VDDERAYAEVLSELLYDEEFDVRRVHSGCEALEACGDDGARFPDLVLCDVMLPGLRGDGLVHELRKRFPEHRLPVVLMSASADPRVQERDVWFLPKPLDFNELMALLGSVLEEPDAASDDAGHMSA